MSPQKPLEVRISMPRELAMDIVKNPCAQVHDMLGRLARDAIVDAIYREMQALTPMPDHYRLDDECRELRSHLTKKDAEISRSTSGVICATVHRE